MRSIQTQTIHMMNNTEMIPKVEGFSANTLDIVSPHSHMFGEHRGHNVIKLDEACQMIKKDLESTIKEGLFKSSRTESILLDIRHTKLIIEQTRNRIRKEIRASFEGLVEKLKDRQNELLEEIDHVYESQLTKVRKEEEKW